MFECQTCQCYFSRTADTPLREKRLKKLVYHYSAIAYSNPGSAKRETQDRGEPDRGRGERGCATARAIKTARAGD